MLSVFYLGNFLFRGVLVAAGGGRKLDWNYEVEIAARSLLDDELPVFTVLVPMFREAAVLPKLAQSLRALDYPLGKLDIKIVLEEGDTETLWAAHQLGLEGVFEVIRVPPSQPQTKPKACNYALRFARGEYVVDLRRRGPARARPAAQGGRDLPPDASRKSPACNAGSTISTPTRTGSRACSRSTIRSGSTWCCRGSSASTSRSRSAAPPTISRSRSCANCAAGIPFNVTEDADLGIRLYEKGYRVAIVNSTTFEEASCHVRQLDAPALALAQGLHADAAGAHAPAAGSSSA